MPRPSMATDLVAKLPLRVDLFGGPTVWMHDQSVALSPLQSCLVAVVFSVNHAGNPRRTADTGTRRSTVARLLWEEDTPETRHRLSQLLYSLSKKLDGENLFAGDSEAVWPSIPPEALDLSRFHELLREGSFGSAIELWERGFLSGLTSVPGRRFEEWLDREQDRVRSALREAAASRWTRLANDESWREAGEAATALLRLNPSSEGALRNVLLAKGMAGQVREALAEYQGFQERAHPDEEAWTPAAETRELLERLRTLFPKSAPRTDEFRREPDPEPVLCGRDQELALLNRAISTPREDCAATTIVVTGEGGIGKTRLVEEALRGAHLRAFRILRAGSSEFERDIPLNPLLEALDHPDAETAVNQLEEPWNSVLLSLLPQFHRGEGPLPEVPYVEPGNLPRRTYEALRRLLVSVTESGPVLLFLDDFQWADETSVAALEFLRRRWNGGRLVIVLALREFSGPRRCRAEEFVEELTRSGKSVHLALEELDEAAVHELIDSVAQRRLDPSECRRISLLAGRNPFFTVELTHEYVEGHLELQLAPGDPLPVPVSIRQLLERRLEELTPLGERILDVLAVVGDGCTVDDLARLCDRSRTKCAAALDRLQSARLVRWSETGFALRHQLVRHTVYSRLQDATRRLLHEQIAEWLEEKGDAGPGELALHFDRAGRPDQALRFALRAADAAEASGAVPEAVHLLTTARRNTSDPLKAADILGRLGHLHHLHRNFTEAAPLLDVAAERFRQQGRISQALVAEVEKIDSLSRLELLPLQDFLQKARELKQEARDRGEWETLINLLDVEIHTLDREGKVDAVREALKEVEGLCDKGSPAAQCAARATLAIHFLYGSPDTALRVGREACKIAETHNLSSKRLLACNRLIATLIPLGLLHSEEGQRLVRTAESLAAISGDRRHRFFLPLNQGVWHLDLGEYAKAERYFARARLILQEHPEPELKANLFLNLGELAYMEGDVPRARRYFGEVVNRIGCSAGVPAYEIGRAGLGLCSLYEGKLAEAATVADALMPEPADWVFDRCLIILFRARLLRRRNRIAKAATLLREAGKSIRKRFILSWIKLQLEEARLVQRDNPNQALSAAKDALGVASALGLSTRERELQRLIDVIH